MKRYGQVYLHTNKVNGKVYVGKTTDTLARRCRKKDKTHRSYATCPIFKRALDKYGWDNFITVTLGYADDLESLNALETKYLIEYDSANPDKGYNVQKVSDGPGKHADSTKEKLSISHLEHNKRLKEAGIVKIAPNRKEYKLINGLNNKHCSGKDHWLPLDQFNNNSSKWDGLNMYCKECQSEQSREQKNKRKVLLSEEARAKSYTDRIPALREGQRRFLDANPGIGKIRGELRKQAIIRIDPNTGETKEYDSGLAVKADGFDNTYVSQCCNGKRKMFKGYKWIKKETGPKDPESNK